jgi:hypothetical protein
MTENKEQESFDMYFSVDIETDGEAPGVGSMLSIGISALHPDTLEETGTFYRTLHRLPDAGASSKTMAWWDQFLDSYVASRKDAVAPVEAIRDMHSFVKQQCRMHMKNGKGPTPIFVAYPASFDFSFVYYYCHRFLGESIFSFSALDMKSYAMGLLGSSFIGATKSNFRQEWQTELPITHHALDDARSQADQFRKMLMWRRAQARTIVLPDGSIPFDPKAIHFETND